MTRIVIILAPMRLTLLLPALLVVALLAACGSDDTASGDRVAVVATTTQAADLVASVGGDRVDVDGLLAPNSDPHDYEPRPSDAEAIAGAALVVRSGGDLDEWLDDVIESAAADPEVLSLIDRVDTMEGGAHAEDHAAEEHAAEDEHAGEEAHAEGEVDPHWWHDPRNGVRAVAAIRDALVAADPGGRATYEANARAYTREIGALDRAVAGCLGAIPAERRKLVTTHDALGYFAARYDIEAIGSVLDSLSTQAQPSAGDTQELIDQIRDEGVQVIFAESSVDPRLERAIADEAGARVGEPLWADTLGPAGSSGDTYLKSIAANANAIARGFGGAPCELPVAR
jgi:zinc/manganese transport system substrate-binding protein